MCIRDSNSPLQSDEQKFIKCKKNIYSYNIYNILENYNAKKSDKTKI